MAQPDCPASCLLVWVPCLPCRFLFSQKTHLGKRHPCHFHPLDLSSRTGRLQGSRWAAGGETCRVQLTCFPVRLCCSWLQPPHLYWLPCASWSQVPRSPAVPSHAFQAAPSEGPPPHPLPGHCFPAGACLGHPSALPALNVDMNMGDGPVSDRFAHFHSRSTLTLGRPSAPLEDIGMLSSFPHFLNTPPLFANAPLREAGPLE